MIFSGTVSGYEREPLLIPKIFTNSAGMYIYFIIIIFLIGLSVYAWRGKNDLARQLLPRANAVPMRGYGHRHEEIFENTSDAIFVVEVAPDGQFSFGSFNSAAMQIIGPDNADIGGQSFNEIFKRSGDTGLQRILRELSAHVTRAIDSGMPVKYESTFNFSSENISKICELSLLPMADDAGISHVLCFAKDVTAAKLYEQELLKRVRLEEKLSGFAASAPGFFYSFLHGADGSNSMPFASAGINDLFELQPDDVVKNISAMTLLIHRDDMKSFFDAMANSAANLSLLEIEFRTHHSGKGELWIESRAMPVSQPDGGVEWHGFMHNITGRKLLELHLKATQDKLRELMLNTETERENERKHIAWEMHEELGQLLAAMKMRLYGMRTQFPKDIPSLGEDSRIIVGIIDKSIKTIRDIVSDLRPPVLQLGLEVALQWQVTEFKKQSGLNCKLEISDDGTFVSEEPATLLFRVSREILGNIARYTGVSRIVVAWTNTRRQTMLTIRHDGDVAGVESSLSLFGIQERVTALGGEVKMFSDLEQVSVIEITLPV